MYMAHVCSHVCCSDSGNVCCVEAVLKDSGFFEHWGVEVCCMFVYGM